MKIRDVIFVAAGVILLSVSATAEEGAAASASKQVTSETPASPAKEKKAAGKKEKGSARADSGKNIPLSSAVPRSVKTPLPSKEEMLRVLDTMLKNVTERRACVEAAADQAAVEACVTAAPASPTHSSAKKPEAADKKTAVPQEGKPAAAKTDPANNKK